MVPHTEDGRVLFAVPWHDRVIVGTTDTEIPEASLDPVPLKEEIDFLLEHAAKYLTKDPKKEDILSAFAGIRPLIKSDTTHDSSSLSRDHHINISSSGLITIAGGKWTTYRKMGEDVVDKAISVAALDDRPSRTKWLNLYGWSADREGNGPFSVYGNNARDLKQMIKINPELNELIHKELPYRKVEVLWGVRHEHARTVGDILSRRTRALILNAKAAIECAPVVARMMKKELNKDDAWEKKTIAEFLKRAETYIVR